ncbi:hypothetical protein K4F52_009687 [Lecanicillium sp. MT-2017a]|nr:hypothetical protein K4F52_009687 [Lecanicillium sp. MT-2017a]
MEDGNTSHATADEIREHEQRQFQMLATASRHLAAGTAIIPELEALVAAIEPTTKSLSATGLPSAIRDLNTDLATLRWLVDELSPSPPVTLPSATLDRLAKKLEVGTVVAQVVARWAVVKRCRGFVALKRTFQSTSREDRQRIVAQKIEAGASNSGANGTNIGSGGRRGVEKGEMHRTLREQAKAEVIVVGRGAEWVDVRWITAERLAGQMADCGWAWGDYEPGDGVDAGEWADMPFAKQVRRVIAAARLNRHEYRIPRVHLVLPNLSRGANEDIDVLLEQLALVDGGVPVTVSDATSPFLTTPPSAADITTTIASMVPDDMDLLTPTLNMEHTILVDLISDLTHVRLAPQPWHSRTTREQIAEENRHPHGVMARRLYPMLRGRRLVCTHEAAAHFHEMLATVGTPSEKERGTLLVPLSEPESCTSHGTLRTRFQALSAHALPEDVQFPVEILPAEPAWDLDTVRSAVDEGTLPAVAWAVAQGGRLKSSRFSTFMYGWAAQVATLTSNKEIRAHLKTWVEEGRTADDETGPQVRCVDITRNLLAKSATPPEGWKGGAANGNE